MLPGAEAQEGDDLGAAGGRGVAVEAAELGGAGPDLGALEVPAGGAVGAVPGGGGHQAPGVHVEALAAPVGGDEGGAGQVGGEDAELGGPADLDEPHEPRPEHGVRRDDHLAPERLDRAVLQVEVVEELLGDRDGRQADLLGPPALDRRRQPRQLHEEEVVVVHHRGVVEGRGLARLACRFLDDLVGFFLGELGFCFCVCPLLVCILIYRWASSPSVAQENL